MRTDFSGCTTNPRHLYKATVAIAFEPQSSKSWGRFHEKFQFETSFGLSLGLKSQTFVLAEFLAQIDFTKGDSAETGLKS